MSQLFKNPLTTPGLIRTVLGPKDTPAPTPAAPSAPSAPAMLLPPPPKEAAVNYTQDDPRWKALQKAGSGNTILSAPSVAYSGTKLGG